MEFFLNTFLKVILNIVIQFQQIPSKEGKKDQYAKQDTTFDSY